MQMFAADQILDYLFAGKSTITIRSLVTETRYTYQVRVSDDQSMFFVSALIGSDNEADYAYIGCIPAKTRTMRAGTKGNDRDPRFIALDWLLKQLISRGTVPATVEVFHEGRCGRCGRKLTTPESIQTGLGPECAKKGTM